MVSKTILFEVLEIKWTTRNSGSSGQSRAPSQTSLSALCTASLTSTPVPLTPVVNSSELIFTHSSPYPGSHGFTAWEACFPLEKRIPEVQAQRLSLQATLSPMGSRNCHGTSVLSGGGFGRALLAALQLLGSLHDTSSHWFCPPSLPGLSITLPGIISQMTYTDPRPWLGLYLQGT